MRKSWVKFSSGKLHAVRENFIDPVLLAMLAADRELRQPLVS